MAEFWETDPLASEDEVAAAVSTVDVPDRFWEQDEAVDARDLDYHMRYQHALERARLKYDKNIGDENEGLPNITAPMLGAGASIVSPATRAVGGLIGGTQRAFAKITGQPMPEENPYFREMADQAQIVAKAHEQAAEEAVRRRTDYPIVARTVRGVVRTVPPMVAAGQLGGPMAAIGVAGVGEADAAVTEARLAGMPESQIPGYAISQGVAEAVPEAIMQGIGMGGTESLFNKPAQQAGTETIRRMMLNAGIRTAQELPEEIVTEVWHNVNDRVSGMDPNALSPESLGQMLVDTTAQTIATAGLLEGVNIADAAIQKISTKEQPSRKDFIDAGLPPYSAEQRKRVAELIRIMEKRRKQPQGATPTPPMGTPVVTGQVTAPPPEVAKTPTETPPQVTEQLPPSPSDEELIAAGWTRDENGEWKSPTLELQPPVQPPQPGQLTPEQIDELIQQGGQTQPQAPQQLPPMEIGPEGEVVPPRGFRPPEAPQAPPALTAEELIAQMQQEMGGQPSPANVQKPAQPSQLPPYRRQPADYMPGQAHGWLHDAVSRRPAGLNTPQEIADWINQGFPQGNWRSYAEQQGHTSLEQSVAKVMDEIAQQRILSQPAEPTNPVEPEPTPAGLDPVAYRNGLRAVKTGIRNPAAAGYKPGTLPWRSWLAGYDSVQQKPPKAPAKPGQRIEYEPLTTISGQKITPPSHLPMDTDRRTGKALDEFDAWLLGHAIAETSLRNDDFNATTFGTLVGHKLSDGDRSLLNEYLFGNPDGVTLTPKAEQHKSPRGFRPKQEDRPAFKQRMFQGRGKTPEQIYGEENVARGAGVPLFGPGRYYSFSPQSASFYGDEVTESEVSLKNPYILDSDQKWRDLLGAANAQHLDNMGRLHYEEPQGIAPAAKRLQEHLKSLGHDGLIVRLDPNSDKTRRLSAMANDDQVVVFETPEMNRGFRPKETPDAGQVPGAETVVPQAGPVAEAGGDLGGQGLQRPEEAGRPAAAPQEAGVEKVTVKRGFRKQTAIPGLEGQVAESPEIEVGKQPAVLPSQEAEAAIAGMPHDTQDQAVAIARKIEAVAKKHGMDGEELWRDVIYQPEGTSTWPLASDRPSSNAEAIAERVADERKKRGPKPKRSFRKGDQAMAAVQRERLPGEVSARVRPLPATETEQTVSVHDIVETIKRDFDVPIRRGKLPAKALGIYRYLPEVIRTQGAHAGNLYVVTHELGHHLDKTTDVMEGVSDEARAELMANDYEPKLRVDEGFAEFIRMYTTTENAQTYLPRFTEHFEKWLGKNPEIKTKVDRIRRLATKWRSMTPEGRALAQIWGEKRKPEALEPSMLDTVAGAMNAAEHFYTKMIDKTYFVQKLARASGAANAIDTASSAEYLAAYEMAAPSRAENALLHGPDTVTERYRKLGPGLQEAFDKHIKSEDDYDSWKAWMLADHTLYMEEKNPAFRTGLDVEDAKAIIDGTDAATADRYAELQKAFVAFNNHLLDVAVDAGVHSAEEAARMKEYYGDHYLPLMRIRDERLVSRLTRRFFNIKTPFRGRTKKGSNLPVMDFLEATILRAMSTYEAAMRQHVLDKLIKETVPEFGGAESLGKFIEKVPPGMKPTEAELGELLDQIVETGIIDEEYAKTLKAVDALRNGRMQSKLIPWLAGKYGVDLSQDDAIEKLKGLTEDVPSLESEIVIWRPVYRTSESERIFRHVVNGKPALFKIDNGLWDSFAGMAPLSLHPGLQTFSMVNKMFKMGATGIKPTFPLTNLIRDYKVFLAQEKHLKGTRRFTEPAKWSVIFAMSELNRLIKNATGKSIFSDNEVTALFDEMSGKIVNSLGVAPSQVSSMRKSIARKSGWSSKAEQAKAAGYRLLQTVRDVIGVFESGPRLAAFNAYLETRGYTLGPDGKLMKDGQAARPTQSELVRAINEARDVTTNFVRSGSAGRFVDQFFPFFNAAVQSQDKEIRTLLDANKDIKSYMAGKALTGAGKRVLTYLVASSALQAAYWWLRHDDDDYEEMPWWLKYGYWTFGIDGKPVAKVPHAHTWNLAPAATEAMLNAIEKQDASEFMGAMTQQASMRNPISGPAGVTPVVEAAFNFDTFRWRNIENQSMLKLPPQYRYRSDTSETAKAIGHVTGPFGFGPLKVEHILNQSTGGLVPSLTKEPWSGVLQKYEPMKSVDDFYEAKDKIEQQATAEKVIFKRDNPELYAKASDMGKYSAMLTEMRAAVRDEKDRDKRFETEKYMIGLARFALGKEPLDRYPNPLTAKNSPDHIKKMRQEEIMRRAGKVAEYAPDSLTDLEKEAGVTIEQKKKNWEASVEQSRKWLKEIGADPAEVRILYKISLDDMKDKDTVARKLNYVEAMMKGAKIRRSWRPLRD